MTPEEVERLLEWAKRAAAGGRFAKPPGDNVRDLLARIAADYPDHPQEVALRQRLTRRLRARGRAAARRGRHGRAERYYRAWLALEPAAAAPRAALVRLAVKQGREALKKRRYALATRQARQALERDPRSVAAHELLGDVATRLRRHVAAAKHFRNALKHVGERQGRLRRRLQAKLARSRRKSR
jgi:Tfp pilus assembly protein PilF